MNTSSSPLASLTAEQHSALFDSARRRAVQLRREAIAQFATAIADAARVLWRHAALALAIDLPRPGPAGRR
jgi:hypothetical protein